MVGEQSCFVMSRASKMNVISIGPVQIISSCDNDENTMNYSGGSLLPPTRSLHFAGLARKEPHFSGWKWPQQNSIILDLTQFWTPSFHSMTYFIATVFVLQIILQFFIIRVTNLMAFSRAKYKQGNCINYALFICLHIRAASTKMRQTPLSLLAQFAEKNSFSPNILSLISIIFAPCVLFCRLSSLILLFMALRGNKVGNMRNANDIMWEYTYPYLDSSFLIRCSMTLDNTLALSNSIRYLWHKKKKRTIENLVPCKIIISQELCLHKSSMTMAKAVWNRTHRTEFTNLRII